MRERPIIFSGEMMLANLDDKKSQTRRAIKLIEFGQSDTPGYDWHFRDKDARWHDYRHGDFIDRHSPYGSPGDRLYSREVWKFFARERASGIEGGVQYRADQTWRPFTDFPDPDAAYKEFEAAWNRGSVNKWRSPIYQPRWASRFVAEVVEVRVQQLMDITHPDIAAEGIGPLGLYDEFTTPYHYGFDKATFLCHWDAINGKKYPSSLNPWLFAYTYKRVEVTP